MSTATTQQPAIRPPALLPQWRLMLHDDDVHSPVFVVHALRELTPLNLHASIQCMEEAERQGVALVLCSHKERIELYQDRLASKGLTVTIEPAE